MHYKSSSPIFNSSMIASPKHVLLQYLELLSVSLDLDIHGATFRNLDDRWPTCAPFAI